MFIFHRESSTSNAEAARGLAREPAFMTIYLGICFGEGRTIIIIFSGFDNV
jgi:hypothetical protein